MRPGRLELRPERQDLRPERLGLRPERLDLRPKRPDLRSQRPDLRSEGPDEGGRMILRVFVPFGPAAQKRRKRKQHTRLLDNFDAVVK